MSSTKKGWLLALLAFAEFGIILFLAPANCASKTDEEKPSSVQHQPVRAKKDLTAPPLDDEEDLETCRVDDDCPADSSCLKGFCILTSPTNYDDEEVEEEFDAGNIQENAQNCDTARDCGCGYDCAYGRCQKSTSICCANADCKTGEYCKFENDDYEQLAGTCTPSECNFDSDCGNKCGTRCSNHRCFKNGCCADSDCEKGFFCELYDGNTEGFCSQAACTSDADCGCGKICDKYRGYPFCKAYDIDRPIECCGTDFFYDGRCWDHENIEDGRCLEDKHCSKGKICSDGICFPATCAENADCGCEAVCRKNHCEMGCDEDADCCGDPDYPVCDRGECINPNPEEE